MEQGEALFPEISDMGVWEPKGVIFELFWFQSWSDFGTLLYSNFFIGNRPFAAGVT